MKKSDKLKRQRYEGEMKIIELEVLEKAGNLTRNQEMQLQILRKKVEELTDRLDNLKP